MVRVPTRGTPTDLWFMRKLIMLIEDIEDSVEVDRNAKMPAVHKKYHYNYHYAKANRNCGDRD